MLPRSRLGDASCQSYNQGLKLTLGKHQMSKNRRWRVNVSVIRQLADKTFPKYNKIQTGQCDGQLLPIDTVLITFT